MLQITQFVVDIIFCYIASYAFALPSHPFYASHPLVRYYYFFGADFYCHGTTVAALFGSGLLTSYLWLFVDFFRTTYTQPAADASKGTKATVPKEKKKD